MSIDELCRRVWEQRYNLRGLGVDPNFKNIFVVVSESDHALLCREARKSPYTSAVVHTSGKPNPGKWTVFGMPLLSSEDLQDGEIRFRSEVAA